MVSRSKLLIVVLARRKLNKQICQQFTWGIKKKRILNDVGVSLFIKYSLTLSQIGFNFE